MSSVHVQIQTRAHAGKIQFRQQKTNTGSMCSHSLFCVAQNLKNNFTCQSTHRGADQNHPCEQLVASVVLLVPEVFNWRTFETRVIDGPISACKPACFFCSPGHYFLKNNNRKCGRGNFFWSQGPGPGTSTRPPPLGPNWREPLMPNNN